jgi:thioredoxin 1
MAGENTRQFDDGNFETEVLGVSGPALIDFGADWCGPCQLLAPVIDELADEYAGKMVIGKVDIEKAVKTASQFNAQSIPLLLFMKDGQEVHRELGLRSKATLKALIAQKLGVGELAPASPSGG